ncbi:uncharacterized protein CCR75_000120 [Bremia lactucae]|uniref:Reverse transcriptase domain-containing protein n=1 Tax=Bremia lactucae TaxID=4779 RepID=A0A976IHR3_BRELC|nr:hypothetical protein CCR75_000120 [Bremia lactucae]
MTLPFHGKNTSSILVKGKKNPVDHLHGGGEAKNHPLGLSGGSMAHSIISFADDCTGLLHDLRHTKVFLDLVSDFCQASGMRLNTAKTVVLPFRPWSSITQPLKLDLQQLGVEVLESDGRVKLMGIYYGPSLSNADRLQHLLADMQTRCSLWDYRARTLRGRVVILQQIILPVLWFSASVCHVPQTGF